MFVECVHILRWVGKGALVAFVNSVSLCGLGLRFWFLCVIIVSFCFVTLVTFFIRVLTNVFGRVIHARAFNK